MCVCFLQEKVLAEHFDECEPLAYEGSEHATRHMIYKVLSAAHSPSRP